MIIISYHDFEQIIGCGILTCMAIVTLTILLSYLVEGREVVQVTITIFIFGVNIIFQHILSLKIIPGGGKGSCTGVAITIFIFLFKITICCNNFTKKVLFNIFCH